jgi:hypothetical protein
MVFEKCPVGPLVALLQYVGGKEGRRENGDQKFPFSIERLLFKSFMIQKNFVLIEKMNQPKKFSVLALDFFQNPCFN